MSVSFILKYKCSNLFYILKNLSFADNLKPSLFTFMENHENIVSCALCVHHMNLIVNWNKTHQNKNPKLHNKKT
jgi:hypothetical protein